ncbi:VOC family protein [Brevundimonas lenta]|uniref:Catechol 2,3-dioxygenase-like lactoylglutathione lyase family enzyme n=1 Tax=Brevundimonas lenta TaxID=424796 RepID=A0A7W6JDB2_9CAUL|nr:VOC family protein [Brevundimonas lenta]MBB4082047.1 catechol 2,3-dioxygenase-like lactoylglutathione lyase family enzyme [Brevundimonas lenta]
MTTVTPMIHVPDVAATARWYEGIGFEVLATAEDGVETTWAQLALGATRVMLNCGGRPATHDRRDVDLYVETDDVEAFRRRFDGRADLDLVEDLHDTFYGMREFIIRDPNGFWITFGQTVSG